MPELGDSDCTCYACSMERERNLAAARRRRNPPRETCVKCGEEKAPHLMGRHSRDYRTREIRYICYQCIHLYNYEECGRCEWYRQDMSRQMDNGELICESCTDDYSLILCPNCPRYVDVGESQCENCGWAFFRLCDECECRIPIDSDGDLCESCQRDECADLVHGWDYKPSLNFMGSGPLYLGFELELEFEYSSSYREGAELAFAMLGDASATHDEIGVGFLKQDGSLSNGFEIVSHPMSYDWAIKNFPWKLLEELQAKTNVYVGNGTGLHVHLSRKGFTGEAHVYKWHQFFYRNQRVITELARRESSQWAAFNSENRRNAKNVIAKNRYYDIDGHFHSDRYTAINPTNSATFELRFFKSTLDKQEALAALGLAYGSVEYTRQLTAHKAVKHHGWDFDAFAHWVFDQPKYKPLANEIRSLTPIQRRNTRRFECAC